MVRTEVQSSNIAGGFVLVPIACLTAAWRACQTLPLGIADFRAWLAAQELKVRRCRLDDDRPAAYSIAELAKLLGVSQRRARASVNRLAVAGLLEWSHEAIGFPDPPADVHTGLDGNLDDPIADSLGRGLGSIAIPRRMLRFLADGARPALIATVLGILLRCLSRRRGGYRGWGRVKASWIARVFGVSLRQVKAARLELIELRWIEPDPSDQWTENRHGRAFQIDLAWTAPQSKRGQEPPRDDRSAKLDGRSLTPPPANFGATLTPPDLHQDLSRWESKKDQEPCRGPAGFSIQGSGNRDRPEPKAAHANSEPAGLKSVPARPTPTISTSTLPLAALLAPRLADVRIEDLKDTGRLLDLLRQAIDGERIGSSEADRLKFVALAEHALAIGKENPPGLFAYLLRGGCWRYITQGDEDRANARIKAYLRGPELVPAARGAAASRPVLSEDARAVREYRRAFAAARYPGDPFPQVRRHDPSWTRERWDAALAELGGA
jgi:hypothetical protein